jgi:hypothetical protein
MVTIDELLLLADITAESLCNKDYRDLLDKVLDEYPDPDEALIDYFSYIITVPKNQIAIALDHFMILPFEDMPEYIIQKPFEYLIKASCFCPPASEGPYPWQSILAKWRIKIQK